MTAAPIDREYMTAVLREVAAKRRAMGALSPENFAKIYLATVFNKPFSRMHRDVLGQLSTLHERRGAHTAIAAPRGHAKSTIVTLAYVLWCLLYQKEPFVVVVSGTAEQAQKLLDHVKRQLETNALIRQDFPELFSAGRVTPWRKDSILLGNGGMLMSCSSGQNLRGARHGRHRPTLIVADDLEDKTQVVSELNRQKLADWFNSTLLKAGDPETNVIVVGTVFHHESLLATLLDPAKSPGWKPMRYQAIIQHATNRALWDRWGELMKLRGGYGGLQGADAAARLYRDHAAEMNKGAVVLWPEQYDYVDLMGILLREGETAFQAEFQNDPLDPEQCLFTRAQFTYWSDRHSSIYDLIESEGERGRFYGGCDPSLGTHQGRGDYSAIIVLYRSPKTRINHVVVADIARRTPGETILAILKYVERYDISYFGVEANNFQELMVENLNRQARLNHLSVTVKPIQNRNNKVARISGLEAEISQGLLQFSRHHQLLLEQLRAFPVGKHDDGPDALEMAVATAGKRRGVAWMSMDTGVIHSRSG